MIKAVGSRAEDSGGVGPAEVKDHERRMDSSRVKQGGSADRSNSVAGQAEFF